jgi:hypothetical protein
MPHRPKSIRMERWDRLFLTIAPKALRVFSNQPDSQHFGGPPSRTTLSPPRSLTARGPSQTLCAKAENQFMLPGFRFLLAAIVLSMSLLIFGLGAAALLRAAHEEFASTPSRRAPPEVMFAQRDDAGSVLAMLRVEPSVVDEKAIEPPIADHAQDQPAVSLAPTEVEKPTAEPDKIAALADAAPPPENSPPSEAPTSEAAAPEIPIETETQAQADAPSSGAETKVAAIAEMTPAASNEGAVTAPDQASAPIDESTRIAETRVATLGGPPVTIKTQTPAKIAPVVRKPAQAKRVIKRRRIAPARVTQQAPQAPADPFARPFGR